MQPLYPPADRRRLARKYRWSAVALWFMLIIVGMALLGAAVGDGDSGFRDDIHPAVAIPVIVVGGAIPVVSLVVLHSRSGLWRRAAKVTDAPITVRGTIMAITHTRLASFVKVQLDGSSVWQLRTRDRNDVWSLPDDRVIIELYGTSGKVLGAYLTERTERVRAASTTLPA